MPDSYLLTAPGGGTQVEIASFTLPEVDFGTKDLLKANYVEGPHTEGALLNEETTVRRMKFPLLVHASHSFPGLGLYDAEALLRKLARPGAYIDLLPQGATSAVRFDVLAGRYDFDYSIHHNREGLRLGRLLLETKPYGYWPTWITVASTTYAGMGAIPLGLPASAILGDAPGFARLVVQPTVTAQYFSPTATPDALLWSFSTRPSQAPFLSPASIAPFTYIASTRAIASTPNETNDRIFAAYDFSRWVWAGFLDIPAALEPAYRGRFRAYAWANAAQPAQSFSLALDAVNSAQLRRPLASVAPVASVSGVAYQLHDLGELTLPPAASGASQGTMLRLWVKSATTNPGTATALYVFGGLYLQPLEVGAGVLQRGLTQPLDPTTLANSPSVSGLMLDSSARQAEHSIPAALSVLGQKQPAFAGAWGNYRGALPFVTPSVLTLNVIHADRLATANASLGVPTGAAGARSPQRGTVSLQYRPRFQFIKGL